MRYDAIQNDGDVAEAASGNIKRMQECRCRSAHGTCLLVDGDLGWSHGMPLEDCDVCWALGGEPAPEAAEFRRTYAVAMVGVHAKAALESPNKPSRDVLVQLTVRHKVISEERFRAPDIQAAIRGPIGWVAVKPIWKKAASLITALWSRWATELEPGVREARQISCFGERLDGTKVVTPCQMLKQSPKTKDWFCGACGCGDNPIAVLGSSSKKGVDEPSKLDFPDLECPLQKPGFRNSRTL